MLSFRNIGTMILGLGERIGFKTFITKLAVLI